MTNNAVGYSNRELCWIFSQHSEDACQEINLNSLHLKEVQMNYSHVLRHNFVKYLHVTNTDDFSHLEGDHQVNRFSYFLDECLTKVTGKPDFGPLCNKRM